MSSNRVIKVILLVGIILAVIKIGDVVLSYSSKDYRQFKQIRTWNSRLIEFEQEKSLNISQSSQFSLNNWLEIVCDRKRDSDKKQQKYNIDTLAIELIEQYYQVDSVFEEYDKKIIEEYDQFYHPYLQGIKYDLDGDGKEEIICYIGSIYSYSTLMIFAENEKSEYEKIYEQNLWLHNEYPYLEKLENKDNSFRLIRTGGFYYRGSGHWLYAYNYLRKIDDQVVSVLETPYRANDYLSLDLINTNVHLINDSIVNGNMIKLRYEYESKGSYTLSEELNYDSKIELELIKNQDLLIILNWSDNLKKFEDGGKGQIQALMNIENDSLQWSIFGDQVNKSINRKVIKYLDERIK